MRFQENAREDGGDVVDDRHIDDLRRHGSCRRDEDEIIDQQHADGGEKLDPQARVAQGKVEGRGEHCSEADARDRRLAAVILGGNPQPHAIERELAVGEEVCGVTLRCFLRPPARRFLHVLQDEVGQECRRDADHEHAAPADDRIKEIIDDGSDQIAARISRLQDARHEAARLGRNRFHCERGADAPFAAHGDAEERAQDEEHGETAGEAGRESEHRVAQDVGHQRRTPAVAVGGAAEDEGADRAHGERQDEREGDGRDLGVEFGRDVADDEHHQEEVEGVEHPAEIGGGDDAFLFSCPAR